LHSTDLGALERRAIEQAMREAAGNKVTAARLLGITRMQLYGRLRKFGLHSM
jgi:transcriptional regulator with GAF, ATPase, and Fis domain